MKKLFAFFLLGVIAFSLPLSAQKSLRFGIRGGYDFINQTINGKILDASNRSGYHIGISLDARIPVLPLGLNISALYTQMDGKTATGGSYQATMTKAYCLDVPVDLKYTIGLGGLGVVLSAGPYVRFNLDGGDVNFKNISDTYKAETFQAGANFGVGLDLGSHFNVGVLYYTSLTDNYSDTKPDLNEVFDKKPDRMSLTATYFF